MNPTASANRDQLAFSPARRLMHSGYARVRRINPGENVNLVAAEQIRSWLGQARESLPRLPIFSFDAGYDAIQLSLALEQLPVGLLVRLRAGRCCYADPSTQSWTGRPRRHGATFVCDDPATWPTPTDTWSATDPRYGAICLQAWTGLHATPQNHATRGVHANHDRSCAER